MSAMKNDDKASFLFRATTREAFVIKILSELLSVANVKLATFRIDAEGIHLSQPDVNNHQLINFDLTRENFTPFRVTRPLNFQISSTNLHRMLKSIKKKDTLTLFIKDNDDCQLGICVQTPDENNRTNTNLRITYVQPKVYPEPLGYPDPTIVTNKEFQKMKNLHNIDKKMTVSCNRPGLITFYCNNQAVYEREVVLGQHYEDEDAHDDSFEPYSQTFRTSYITNLTKCANQSGNVQIFINHDLPIKIKMRAGTLGDLTVLIKSDERIALEQKLEAEKKKAASMGEETFEE